LYATRNKNGSKQEGVKMLSWTITFLIIALIAGVFGFTGIAAASASIAKILFGIFLVLFLVSLVMGLAKKGDNAISGKL